MNAHGDTGDNQVRPLPTATRRRRARRVLFALAAVILSIALLESASSLVLGFGGMRGHRSEPERARYTRYDAGLGWSNVPRVHCDSEFGPGRNVTINRLGMRGGDMDKTDERYRTVCLGDSYTFGYLVGDDETFPHALQTRNERLQVINMGQCGYCLGQEMLWFERDGVPLRPRLVVLTFINDDLDRLVRDFQFECPKPQFLAQDGRLIIRNVPVPPRRSRISEAILDAFKATAIGRLSQKLLDSKQKATPANAPNKVEAAALVIGRLRDLCRSCGADLAVVRLPACRFTLKGIAEDAQTGRAIMAYLRDHPATHGVQMLDLTGAWNDLPIGRLGSLYGPDRLHPSPEGHAWLAEQIDRWLPTAVPSYPVGHPDGSMAGAP